ncbi:MAG: HDOD domain-containing protein, partial [Melioribacteraceae bacterium]|nr:HDOD domain-containing protein [Melioribacteraceae bacterium]
LILYVQIFGSYESNMRVEKIHREIWNHSLKVASNAKLLVANLGDKKDTETAYIAGLLHDIGKLIIINTEDYIYEILELMKLENIEYNEAELKILGTTHAEIGGYLLSLWGLPKIIVESVLNHHNVSQTNSNNIDIVTSVYLANICADKTQMDPELLANNGFEKISSEVLTLCG